MSWRAASRSGGASRIIATPTCTRGRCISLYLRGWRFPPFAGFQRASHCSRSPVVFDALLLALILIVFVGKPMRLYFGIVNWRMVIAPSHIRTSLIDPFCQIWFFRANLVGSAIQCLAV